MKMSDLCKHSLNSLHKELRHTPRPHIVEWMRSNDSAFCRALVSNGYLTDEQMCRAAERYRLGITRDGGVIFWQIDENQTTRDGKIMFYSTDCHRDHSRHPSWASARLKQHQLLPQEFQPSHCLFGLHLLGSEEGRVESEKSAVDGDSSNSWSETKTVCVVESEKTAVILSEHFTQYLWMASGGLTMLTAAMLQPLLGRKTILFPDTDPEGKAYQLWRDVAATASEALGHTITVSPVLEQHATTHQKCRKIDLVDFLFHK